MTTHPSLLLRPRVRVGALQKNVTLVGQCPVHTCSVTKEDVRRGRLGEHGNEGSGGAMNGGEAVG